jgi:hypothetical protein
LRGEIRLGSVPVYRCDPGGRERYAISYCRDGRRL